MIKGLVRRTANLLSGRKRVLLEDIDFDRAHALLTEAENLGVSPIQVKMNLGGSSNIKRDYPAPTEIIETMDISLKPIEFKTEDGKWVYTLKFAGNHEVYRGKTNEVHYLDMQTILFGGCHRFETGDLGKKPHPNDHWMKLRYSIPVRR